MKKLGFYIAFMVCSSVRLLAQPTPAAPQTESILILNATAHLGNGEVIQNAAIGFEKGKLTLVADATTIRLDMSKYKKVIQAAGKHVYPSLIAPNTPLGLVEIESVRATVDHTEVGEYNPSVRSIVAYNTDSHVLPTVRSNGVLLVQIVPQGGRISGSSSVVTLDAWNWEDAAYAVDNGMHLRFPSLVTGGFSFESGFSIRKNENYGKEIAELDLFFEQARAYLQKQNPMPKNLKFEALRPVFEGEAKLFAHANMAKEITDAVMLAKKFGFKTVIVEAKDAWRVADFLKTNNIEVIISETQDLPSRTDDDIDQPFKTPAMLQKAGVTFCMSVNGGWQQRNLPLMVGQAVAFGLPYEEGVKACTQNAAQILGIGNTVGTLEVGKDATLFIAAGDVFDMKTSKVETAFINGREIDLDTKHKQLYKRFQTKYDRQGKK